MTDLVYPALQSDFSYLHLLQQGFPTHVVESPHRLKYFRDGHADCPDAAADTAVDDGGDFIPSPRARQIFGDNLRRARRLQNLTQKELATRAGVSRSYLGEVEQGIHNICVNRMEDLAREIGLDLRDLLDVSLYMAAGYRRRN